MTGTTVRNESIHRLQVYIIEVKDYVRSTGVGSIEIGPDISMSYNGVRGKWELHIGRLAKIFFDRIKFDETSIYLGVQTGIVATKVAEINYKLLEYPGYDRPMNLAKIGDNGGME